MIWIWSVPDDWPNHMIGEYVKNSGTDRFAFRESRVIKENIIPPKITFECSKDDLEDVLPNSGFLIIVSKKVVEIMENLCPKDIQVFEANIFIGEEKVQNYYLINVVNALEIVNRKESEFRTIKGTNAILNFKKIVYKYENLFEHHIVRNADYRSHVLVSDKLKEAFEKSEIKGVQFN